VTAFKHTVTIPKCANSHAVNYGKQ